MIAPENAENYTDVVIVGAGISGINFAYRLQERCPNLSYTILEGRHELGGTWSLFQYPGIRSDSDLYTFGFPWRPWKGDDPIAKGEKIINYLRESASINGIDKKIRYNHHVNHANYSNKSQSWSFDVTVNGSEKKTFNSRWFLLCTGYYDYSSPLKAAIPGIDSFDGKVVHPQFWPKDLDYADKEVVIIGSGATAITIVPSIADKVKHVTMLQRSPSYILAMPKEDGLEKAIRSYAPAAWQDKLMRWKWLVLPFLIVNFAYYFPKACKKFFLSQTQPQLPQDLAMDPHFQPSYYPFQQRVCFCPSGDFYKSLRSGKASVETGVIEEVTPNSIKLTSGKELHPDIIVTATGLRLRIAGGMTVSVDSKPFPVTEKFIWKGVMLEDLPNFSLVIGYVDASWTLGADATAQHVCRIMKQSEKEGVVAVIPRRTAEEKATMKDSPLLSLTSTYIKEGGKVLPRTGDSGPWRPRSFYFKDIAMAWFGNLRSGTEWVRGV